MPVKMKRTTIFLPEWQVKELAADFKKTGIRPAESIRRALDEWFNEKYAAERQRKSDPVLRSILGLDEARKRRGKRHSS
jgi:hypothetical protein